MDTTRWEWGGCGRWAGPSVATWSPRSIAPLRAAPASTIPRERGRERAPPSRWKARELSEDKEKEKDSAFETFLRGRTKRRRKFPSETGLRPLCSSFLSESYKRRVEGERSVPHVLDETNSQDPNNVRTDLYMARRNASPGVARALDWRLPTSGKGYFHQKSRVKRLLGAPEKSGQKSLTYYQVHPCRLKPFSDSSVTPIFFKRSESDNVINKSYFDSRDSDNRRNEMTRHVPLSPFNTMEYRIEPYRLQKLPPLKFPILEKRITNKCKSEFQFHAWRENPDGLDTVKQQNTMKQSLLNVVEDDKEEKSRQKTAQNIPFKNAENSTVSPQKQKVNKTLNSASGINTYSTINSEINPLDRSENHTKCSYKKDMKSIENTSDSTHSPTTSANIPTNSMTNISESSHELFSRDESECKENISKQSKMPELKNVEEVKETQISTKESKNGTKTNVGTVTNNAANINSTAELSAYLRKYSIHETHELFFRSSDKNLTKQEFQNVIEPIERDSKAKVDNACNTSKTKNVKEEKCSNIDIFEDMVNAVRYNSVIVSPEYSPSGSDSIIQPSDSCSHKPLVSKVDSPSGVWYKTHNRDTSKLRAIKISESSTPKINILKINESNSLVDEPSSKTCSRTSTAESSQIKKSHSIIQDKITISSDKNTTLKNLTDTTNRSFEECMIRNEFLESTKYTKLKDKEITESRSKSILSSDIQTSDNFVATKREESKIESNMNNVCDNSEKAISRRRTFTSNYSSTSKTYDVTMITKKKNSKYLENIPDFIEQSNKINEDGLGDRKPDNKISVKNKIDDNDHDCTENTLNTEMDISLDTPSDKSPISDFIISNDKSSQHNMKGNTEGEVRLLTREEPSGDPGKIFDEDDVTRTSVNMEVDEQSKSISMPASNMIPKGNIEIPSCNKKVSSKLPEKLSLTTERKRAHDTPNGILNASHSDSNISRETNKTTTPKNQCEDRSQKNWTESKNENFDLMCNIYRHEARNTVAMKENLKEKLTLNTNSGSIQCASPCTSNLKRETHTNCQTKIKNDLRTETNCNSCKSCFHASPVTSITMFPKDNKDISNTFNTPNNSNLEIIKIPMRSPCRLSEQNAAQEKPRSFSKIRSMFRPISAELRRYDTPRSSYQAQDNSKRINSRKRKKITSSESRTDSQKSTINRHSSGGLVSRGYDSVSRKIFPSIRNGMTGNTSTSNKFCSMLNEKRENSPSLMLSYRKLNTSSSRVYSQPRHLIQVNSKMAKHMPSNTVHTQTDWIIPPFRVNDEFRLPERKIPPFCATYFRRMTERSSQDMYVGDISHRKPFQTSPESLDFANDGNFTTLMPLASESLSMSRPSNFESRTNYFHQQNIKRTETGQHEYLVSTSHHTHPIDPLSSNGFHVYQSPDLSCARSSTQAENSRCVLQDPRHSRMKARQEEIYFNYFQRAPLNNRDNEISLRYDRHVASRINDEIFPTTPDGRIHNKRGTDFKNMRQTPCNNSLNSAKGIFKYATKSIEEPTHPCVEHTHKSHRASVNDETNLQEKTRNKYYRYKSELSRQYSSGGSRTYALEPAFKVSKIKTNAFRVMSGEGQFRVKDESIKRNSSCQSRLISCDKVELCEGASKQNPTKLRSPKFTVWHM